MILITNSKLYDKLKFIAQIVLPALATLYFALAGIWGLPDADKVVGTIVAVDTFMGVVLQLSSTAYAKSDARFDGAVNVTQSGDKELLQLEFDDNDSVEKLSSKKEIVFKVNKKHPRTPRPADLDVDEHS